MLLIVFDVVSHLVAAFLTRQPTASGLAATVQLGVPAAVVALGLTLNVVSPGAGAAIMVAAADQHRDQWRRRLAAQSVRRRSVAAPSASASAIDAEDDADVEREAGVVRPARRDLRQRVVGVRQRQHRRHDAQPRRPCPHARRRDRRAGTAAARSPA